MRMQPERKKNCDAVNFHLCDVRCWWRLRMVYGVTEIHRKCCRVYWFSYGLLLRLSIRCANHAEHTETNAHTHNISHCDGRNLHFPYKSRFDGFLACATNREWKKAKRHTKRHSYRTDAHSLAFCRSKSVHCVSVACNPYTNRYPIVPTSADAETFYADVSDVSIAQ